MKLKFYLTLLLLLAAITATAYDFEVDGIYYNINGNKATVTSGTNRYTGDVTIPETVTHNGKTYSVTAIDYEAFYFCRDLTNVTIPNSVTHIGRYAFDYCSGLTSMTIPNSVIDIGVGAFRDCIGLTNLTVESGNNTYDSRDECNAIIETSSNKLIVGCKNTVIPNSVISIGDNAFYGCRELTSITIPNSVIGIGREAFHYCSGLTSLEIPNSVTIIGYYAFEYCHGLTSVTIGNSVSNVGIGAFRKCENLENIIVDSGNPFFDSRDNCNAIINTSSNTLIIGCKGTVIPNSVTAIRYNAFEGCSGLTGMIIPNSVTEIGDYAFWGCSGMESLTIGNSVSSIGGRAFFDCGGLKSIIVDSGNPTYDSRNECNAIIETSSNTLIVGGTNTVIPYSVTAIGDYSFWGRSDLKSLDIPFSVTTIGDEAFTNCQGLTSLIIPKSVTHIGAEAFSCCGGLTSLTIGSAVAHIGDEAFSYCSALTDVYCHIVDPSAISMGNDVFFQEYPYSPKPTLHVQQGTADAYQADEKWYPYFKQIVEDVTLDDLRGDVNGDGAVDIADINAVVDIILERIDFSTIADVNNDGEINIADINAIIEIIQGNSEEPETDHEWVNLGLPSGTLWATMNVGASKPEELGDYFAWGETEPKNNYIWYNYKWCNGGQNSLTKYCTNSSYGTVDNKTELDPEDDAASVNWGSSWCMPTESQRNELSKECTWQWTAMNGVNGFLVTGRNGNSIFLPAAGCSYNYSSSGLGSVGYYWTRSLSSSSSGAYSMYFYQDSWDTWISFGRYRGHSVRAVRALPDNPDLYIEQHILDMGWATIAKTCTGKLTIVNNSSESMTLTATADAPFLLKQENDIASSMDVVVPGNSRVSVTVLFTATSPGDFNGYVTFQNPALDGGQIAVQVFAHAISSDYLQQEYVDLGLPSGTLWATTNVGASSPEEYGDYLAWGETEPKNVYTWETYKWCNGSDRTLTKYCTASEYGTVDGKAKLDPEDDAAFVNLGSSWRMPTKKQFSELRVKCNWNRTTINGVKCHVVTGPNGNKLFLPFAGYRQGSSLVQEGVVGDYWTCELSSLSGPELAEGSECNTSGWVGIFGAIRCNGCAVRAVRVSQQ